MMKKNRKKFQLNYDEMEDGGRVSMENDEIKQTRQKKLSSGTSRNEWTQWLL